MCWSIWYPYNDPLQHYIASWWCPCSPRSTSGISGTCSCDSPSLIVLLMLINLIPHMTYFMTTLHLMEVSVLTKINFFGLEKFLVLFIASTLPLHADRCDVLHPILQHCFTLCGHVRGHQDQLLVVGELFLIIYCIYFAYSYCLFWCAAWPTSTLPYVCVIVYFCSMCAF